MGVALLRERGSTEPYSWMDSLVAELVWVMTFSNDLSMVASRSNTGKSARLDFRHDGGWGMSGGSCGKVRKIAT